MERLFSSPRVRRGGRTGGASGLLDRGHPVSRALGQGSPRPEHTLLLAGAVACGGALWARCWGHPGRPGALGYGPFSRPPRRNRRSGLVPGHLLWSHIHALRDADLYLSHPGWSLGPHGPAGLALPSAWPQDRAWVGAPHPCAPHTLSSHSSSFQSAQELLGEWDFPGGSDGKASAYNVGDLGSIPGSGRSPGEGNGNPLQYSCLEIPMDGGAW